MEAGPSAGDAHESDSGNKLQTTVEIKIKTLDSQVFTCQVERDIPVPALKERIASLTGVPAENQRLICRGKVLKDDHLLSAYGVEDGHTLHLVTRQAPPANPSSSTGGTRNDGTGEGNADPDPATSRGRTGQISHSVVLGTFNMPDQGDAGMSDIGRIISSVLNSLGISNLVPVNAGVTNGGSVAASGSDDQARVEAGSDRQQIGVNIPMQASSLNQSGPRELQPLTDSIYGLRPTGGFVGAIPAAVPQIRLVQQAMVVPDALATLSQYLTRMEQVFAVNGQQTASSTLPSRASIRTDQVAGDRAYPSPEALSAIIRRTQDLLSNQTASELGRLASMLENNASLNDAAARDEVQSTALRDGMLMQHMGALLLELGRTTLTLRMGSLPAESIVNAGPAVFISSTGPNPMMVQPLPFPASTLTQQPPISAMPPAVVPDASRNINIHIHAGELGPSAPFAAVSQVSPAVSQPLQTSVAQGSSLVSGVGSDPLNRSSIGIPNPLVQGSSGGSLQGVPVSVAEHGAIRVLPMRTLVAAVPAALHSRPPTDASGAAVGMFYPLLARFQQLGPGQLSQPHATYINGAPVGHAIPAVSAQQQPPTSVPTVRAQVQVQAWVPSGSHVLDGQTASRPINFDGMVQLPFISSVSETSSMVQQQQSLRDVTAPIVGEQNVVQEQPILQATPHMDMAEAAVSDSLHMSAATLGDGAQQVRGIATGVDNAALQVGEECQQTGVSGDEQLEVPVLNKLGSNDGRDHESRPNRQEGKHLDMQDTVNEKHDSLVDSVNGVGNKVECPTVQSSFDLAASSSSRELSKSIGSSDAQENGSAAVPVGLGGMQPLPSRMHMRSSNRSDGQHPPGTGTSGHGSGHATTQSIQKEGDQAATGSRSPNILHNVLGSLTSRSESTDALSSSGGQVPQGLLQLFNSVGSNLPTGGGSIGNIGELISHFVGNQAHASLAQGTRNMTNQAFSPPSSVAGMMAQVMQSPLTRNVLQQVMEQIGDGPQGDPDFSGLFQQVMPIVSRALLRPGRSDVEPTENPENIAEQGTTQDGAPDSQKQPMNQDELALLNETVSSEQQQPRQDERSENEVCPGNAPVAKRQKMDLEGTVKKLEQDDSPEEIVSSVAESAANLMASIQSAEVDTLDLAQRLSGTGDLANEYVSLLFRDLRARAAADTAIHDDSELLQIFQVLEKFFSGDQ